MYGHYTLPSDATVDSTVMYSVRVLTHVMGDWRHFATGGSYEEKGTREQI